MPVRREGRLEDSLERYQKALPHALTVAGMVVLTRIQRVFVLFRPRGWATGMTVRSLTVSPPYYDGTYVRVRIGPTTKYSWFLEHGRKPGKRPPFDAILDWVKEKHIAGSYQISVGKRGIRYKRSGGRRQHDAENRTAAFLIARKIGEQGTTPFPAVRVGFLRAREEALSAFSRAMMQGMIYA